MKRTQTGWLLLLGVGITAAVPRLGVLHAQTAAAPPPPVEEVLVTAPEPRYVAATTRDRIGRIWAPVLINGRGPYRLVLDTGATRPALVQRVADELGLPAHWRPVKLRGVTGAATVPAVRVDSFEFGELLVARSTVPIVPDAFGGADGVLGGAGLEDKRIVIEFRKDRISISRSKGAPAPPGFTTLPFRHGWQRGLQVDLLVGSVRAVALIDTGAQATVGNLALREALARSRREQAGAEDSVVGVTADVQQGQRVRVPGIYVGDLVLRNAEFLFSDLYIFDHWNLQSRPALLVGMDVLGVLDTLIIDYRRNELHVRPRG
jgi:predicted aspartyl protease